MKRRYTDYNFWFLFTIAITLLVLVVGMVLVTSSQVAQFIILAKGGM